MNKFWEEQMAHEPTRKYYEALEKLIDKYPMLPETMLDVLEIGLDVGISARCFLGYPNIKLTSVDCGDVDVGIKEIKRFAENRWTFMPMTSDKYFEQCKTEYDIIFIDGLHTYKQVKKDIDNAWKFIKSGGILIGHDIIHKGNFRNDSECGVAQAFAEFIDEKNVEATIYPPHPGLIVIKK